MDKLKMLEVIHYIGDDIIVEAEPIMQDEDLQIDSSLLSKKKSPKLIWCAGVAACLSVVGISVLLGNMEKTSNNNDATTPSTTDSNGLSTLEEYTNNIVSDNILDDTLDDAWNDTYNHYKYTAIEFNGQIYRCSQVSVDQKHILAELGTALATGYDNNGLEHTKYVPVYQEEDLDIQHALTVYYEDTQEYYLYFTSNNFDNLEQFAEAFNIDELSVIDAVYTSKEDGIETNIYFADPLVYTYAQNMLLSQKETKGIYTGLLSYLPETLLKLKLEYTSDKYTSENYIYLSVTDAGTMVIDFYGVIEYSFNVGQEIIDDYIEKVMSNCALYYG